MSLLLQSDEHFSVWSGRAAPGANADSGLGQALAGSLTPSGQNLGRRDASHGYADFAVEQFHQSNQETIVLAKR